MHRSAQNAPTETRRANNVRHVRTVCRKRTEKPIRALRVSPALNKARIATIHSNCGNHSNHESRAPRIHNAKPNSLVRHSHPGKDSRVSSLVRRSHPGRRKRPAKHNSHKVRNSRFHNSSKPRANNAPHVNFHPAMAVRKEVRRQMAINSRPALHVTTGSRELHPNSSRAATTGNNSSLVRPASNNNRSRFGKVSRASSRNPGRGNRSANRSHVTTLTIHSNSSHGKSAHRASPVRSRCR